jgi:hypothetical protein
LIAWFSIAGLQKKHYQTNETVFPENLAKNYMKIKVAGTPTTAT